jgi:hypothetical protein
MRRALVVVVLAGCAAQPMSDQARSRALFADVVRVLTHPRCLNCHPAGDSPTQGDQARLHDPPVARDVPGLSCTTCHQDHNLSHARVPGAPKWGLAPSVMAWAGRTPHEICEQLKDGERNGHRSLAQIVEHAAHDPLVAWAWSPGAGRSPAPGMQEQFGAAMAAWVESGAVCP